MKSLVVDLDGTIYNWHIPIYNKLVELDLVKDDYDTFWKDLWFKEPYQSKISELVNDPYYYTARPIEPKIVKALNKLSKEYKIYYVTQRPLHCEEATRKHLTENKLPQVENLTVLPNKIDFINQLKPDYIIDDREGVLEKVECKTKFLVTQLWNLKAIGDFTRLHSFTQLNNYLIGE